MPEINSSTNAAVLAANNSQIFQGKSSVPVTLSFSPAELGIDPRKAPPTVQLTENQIERKLFQHFGLNADEAKKRLSTQDNPFDQVKTRGNFTATYNPRTGKYQITDAVEKGLYDKLSGTAARLRQEMTQEKNQTNNQTPLNPNDAVAMRNGTNGQNQRANLENKLPQPIPQPHPTPTPVAPTNGTKDVSQMSVTEKLGIVFQKAIEHLGPEAGEKLKQLLSPENIAIMAGTTAALIAVQGVPVLDVIVDVAVGGLAVYSLGSEAIGAIGDLVDFATKTINAKSEQDLDDAGKSLAKATATIGVDALAAVLIHKGVKSIKGGELPPPNTKVVEMVTPEGFKVRVRVPVEEPNAPQKGGNVLEARKAGDPPAGSVEHKELRWKEYQETNKDNPNAWSYERWSKNYDLNQNRAKISNAAVEALKNKLGWGETEVPVEVEFKSQKVKIDDIPEKSRSGVVTETDAKSSTQVVKSSSRRLDIADIATKRAVEHKKGSFSLNKELQWELTRDKELVSQGWKITWYFEGTASKPLVNALEKAGIKVVFEK